MKKVYSIKSLIFLFFLNFVDHNFLQASANPTAAISRVYGDYFINEFGQKQSLGVAGNLDLTFGLNGILNCSSQLLNGQVRAIQALPNGVILATLYAPNSNSFLVAYDYAGNLVTNGFGNGGIVDLGVATLQPHTMLIDAQNRILIAGGNDSGTGNSGWLKRVDSKGLLVTPFLGADWKFIGALAQQSTGAILAAGHNNNNAQIIRYTPGSLANAGVVDTSFATSGSLVFNGLGNVPLITTGLYSMIIDANDAIYVAYVDANSNVNVIKFNNQGVVDTTFGKNGIAPITYLKGATPEQLRIALDSNKNIIVAAQVNGSLNVASLSRLCEPILK